jgi:DNA-binding transcriptional regulator GbsR (MarR family)
MQANNLVFNEKEKMVQETKRADSTQDQLTPISRRFVMHWGEMSSRWGINRTVAQIHALLFLSARPMDAEEIADILVVARSNVSNSLKELQNYKLINVVHLMGERREHFETSKDVWELFRVIVRERKAREFDPTVAALKEYVADPDYSKEKKEVQLRIKETLGLMSIMSDWSEEILRMEPSTLTKLMKLGSKIQKVLRGGEK